MRKILTTGAVAVLLLSGCAGTSADRDFRTKVKSVSAGGALEQDGEVTRGKGQITVEFREPK
jgi:outer membrane murein-binding lipoprotein Lpp